MQSLIEGNKSVEDYAKETKIVMMQANMIEECEATMASIFDGLNQKIANVIELQHYVELDDIIKKAVKV